MKVQKAVIIVLLSFVVTVAVSLPQTVKLNKLMSSIATLKGAIKTTHRKKQSVQQQLRENEIVAGNLALKLRRIDKELKTTQLRLKLLYREQKYYQNNLLQQRQSLIEQMRAIYMLGKQPVVKLLLNKQDPNQLSRVFVYYNYLQKYRIGLISRINYTLHKLQLTKMEIKKQRQKLQQVAATQHREYKHILVVKKTRAVLLDRINGSLKTKTARLEKLLADKKALEKVIARLERQTVSAAFATPLSKLRKKLAWPAKGKIDYLYGKSIANSQLHWQGVIIEAQQGQNVCAIATGKVVFAQWLRGYGLLLIVNHGHGYMSLYGRNNSLYRKVGDVVHAGELVATVGDSGGFAKPGLYFAIRHDGKAVNPKLWCR